MEYAIREENGATVIMLEGEVDLEHSPDARELLLESLGRGQPVLVDLARVTYMDSSGLASLVEAFQLARKRSVRFGLAAVGPAVLRVFELARLDRVFTIHETVEDGLRADG